MKRTARSLVRGHTLAPKISKSPQDVGIHTADGTHCWPRTSPAVSGRGPGSSRGRIRSIARPAPFPCYMISTSRLIACHLSPTTSGSEWWSLTTSYSERRTRSGVAVLACEPRAIGNTGVMHTGGLARPRCGSSSLLNRSVCPSPRDVPSLFTAARGWALRAV
jgi:hypothetical protein